MKRITIALASFALLAACGASESHRPKTMASPAPMPDPLVEACKGGVAKSCLIAGDDYERKGNVPQAVDFYQRACDGGERDGCLLAGGLLVQEASGHKRGVELLRAVCDQGEPAGCHGAALALEGIFGAEPADEEAAALHRRACETGYGPSCGRLGSMSIEGRGVPKDDVAGRELLINGCDREDARSCVDLAKLMLRNKELSGTITLLQRACDLGEGAGCTELAFSYADGRGVDASAVGARELFRRGCEADLADPRGCTMLGWSEWSGIGGDAVPARGKDRLTSACEDDGLACFYLGAIAREQGDLTTSGTRLDEACARSPRLCEWFRANVEDPK